MKGANATVGIRTTDSPVPAAVGKPTPPDKPSPQDPRGSRWNRRQGRTSTRGARRAASRRLAQRCATSEDLAATRHSKPPAPTARAGGSGKVRHRFGPFGGPTAKGRTAGPSEKAVQRARRRARADARTKTRGTGREETAA